MPPRERIIAAARDLFYRHGIRAVGVDAIAEAAGTNKMTLYRHFESKDALVAEYLRGLAVEKHDVWSAIEAAHPGDPRAQLEAWLVEAARPCQRSEIARLRARQCRGRTAGKGASGALRDRAMQAGFARQSRGPVPPGRC